MHRQKPVGQNTVQTMSQSIQELSVVLNELFVGRVNSCYISSTKCIGDGWLDLQVHHGAMH